MHVPINYSAITNMIIYNIYLKLMQVSLDSLVPPDTNKCQTHNYSQ